MFEVKISEMKEYASLLVLVNFLMIDVFDEKFFQLIMTRIKLAGWD